MIFFDSEKYIEMDSELKSHDLRSSFSSETELRKRTQALANQAKNLHPKADTIEYKERQHQQQNGHKEKEFYPMVCGTLYIGLLKLECKQRTYSTVATN